MANLGAIRLFVCANLVANRVKLRRIIIANPCVARRSNLFFILLWIATTCLKASLAMTKNMPIRPFVS